MAQRSNQRQPVYSADTLALRYLGGLALVALGVMMFLAVALRLEGNVFDALRQVCLGLTGGLAVILPALPIWAGALVIWSSQKKAPVKPFAWACLGFTALCAFVVLVTKMGQEEFLAALARMSDGSWGGVIMQGYMQSAQLGASGGALGVILGYPFWSLVGTLLGAAVLLLAVIACVMMAVGLTPKRIRALATGKASFSLRSLFRRQENRAEQDQRQIAWQAEQARQRQAYEQQQAWMIQQEQAQARQNSAAWQQNSSWPTGRGQMPQGWPQPGENRQGRTGRNAPVTDNSVAEWQQQLTDQRAARKSVGRSSIFAAPEAGASAGTQEKSQEEKKPFVSRIFGRGRQDDGLSELSGEEKRREGMAYPGSRTPQGGRTNPGGFTQAQLDSTSRNQRIRAAQEQVEADLDPWRQPAAETAPAQADPARTGQEETDAPAREKPETRGTYAGRGARPAAAAEADPAKPAARGGETDRMKRPAAETTAAGTQPETRPTNAGTGARPATKTGSWMDQVLAAAQDAEEEAPSRPETPRQTEPAAPETEETPAVRVPVVQTTIENPTWTPTLKNVDPPAAEPEDEYWEPTPYYAPPITDLKKPEISVLDTSEEDAERSVRLEETLKSFKVLARVVHVTHGPAISRFELELAPGTKVGKVAELEKDIAYGMEATSVRIEAPIPGKSLVGVEVPNPKRATVTLREVLESEQMSKAKSILTVALGKDIAGTPVVCDLAKMPHMLIAGATGSGKSVCINTIINSLLFRASPDEVRLILVDPKVVELQCYNGIPHLLLPVVNDPHKASAALAWAVAEMMERYDKFAERGVRNLQGYNEILEDGEKPMPRIVIIIDELADLMMVCKKDVEEYICRLTQLARAAGIHLIVATQRPSVDVITGLIKANIPSRIAFKTASYTDSRTILDRNGSEQLMGWGDMLYLPTGSFAPTRIQGCFLSDEEVNRIADHVRQANPSSYDPDVLDKLEQLTKGQEEGPGMDMIGGPAETGGSDTGLFEQAVEYAIADGQISTSTLQRRLKVGYARAGRLTDEMEERGIVSAKDGSKPRKCLITREEWEQMKAAQAAS